MKEQDIRPAKLFEEYLRLSSEDAKKYFNGIIRDEFPCLACGCKEYFSEFSKNQFEYVSCPGCGTLYQSPRPRLAGFEDFYNNSASSRYWTETFFPSVAETRRLKIFKPRVKRLMDVCTDRNINPLTVMDVGAGYGIFLEEWQKHYPEARLIAIEPYEPLADVCRNKGLEVVSDFAEKISGYDFKADLVVCFEVLEHVYDPLSFIKILKKFVKPGGYLMVSTLCVDGFDIQVLWEKSNSISPPHHINFFSIEGFRILFSRALFKEIDISTPGSLDVDIVTNAFLKDPTVLKGNRFLKGIFKNKRLSNQMQKFLVKEKLSSHAWIIARNL